MQTDSIFQMGLVHRDGFDIHTYLNTLLQLEALGKQKKIFNFTFENKVDFSKLQAGIEELNVICLENSSDARIYGEPSFAYTYVFHKNAMQYTTGVLRLRQYSNKITLVNLVTNDPTIHEKIMELCSNNTIPKELTGSIEVLAQEVTGRLTLRQLTQSKIPFISDNYSEKVQKAFKRICTNLSSPNPDGRIVILEGPPGTGKSHFIRGLVEKITDVTFLIIPPNMIESIGSPSLIPIFLDYQASNKKPLIMLMEDADECLLKRQSDNMARLSSLLNQTDGIYGDALDIRVIATTNAKKLELDPAVTRPGRLAELVEFPLLTSVEAATVFQRLTGKELTITKNAYTLAEVYQLAKETE
jgi:hypothetical protein